VATCNEVEKTLRLAEVTIRTLDGSVIERLVGKGPGAFLDHKIRDLLK
jgi:hypothetical protein